MNKIIFGNGKEMAINYFSASEAELLIKTEFSSQEELEELFRDPVAMRTITHDNDGEQETHENFTQFEEIRKDKKEVFTVIMSKDGKDVRTRLSDVEKDVEALKIDVNDAMRNGEMTTLLRYTARRMSDEEIVNVPGFVDKWEVGKAYEEGDRVSFNVNGLNVLYKVITKHTSQADWTPDNAQTLYQQIADETLGTKEKPIAWADGMVTVKDVYYKDEGKLYVGLENSEVSLFGKPRDLGRYFKEV